MKMPWQKTNQPLTVGIDIDINTVKLIALKKTGASNPTFQLIGYAHTTTTREFPSVAEAVRNALQQADIPKKSKIVIALPYGQVLTQTIQLDAMHDLSKLEDEIASRCEQMISYPIHEACIDFELTQDDKNESVRDVRVAIARRSAVEEKINLFGSSGFSVSAVDVESDALARCTNYISHQPQGDVRHAMTTAIHIGSQKILGLVLYQEKIVFAQEIVICITDAAGIKKEHYLEKIKILYPILELVAHNFSKDQKLNITDQKQRVETADRVYTSGSPFIDDNFKLQIEQIIGKKIYLINPFVTMVTKESINIKVLEKYAQSLVISCGLAMRD